MIWICHSDLLRHDINILDTVNGVKEITHDMNVTGLILLSL